jgi:chromosome partitioning protein
VSQTIKPFSQHSLTVSFGLTEPDKQPVTLTTMMQAIINETDIDSRLGIIHHADGIDLLPSNSSLAGMEIDLAGLIGRETVLRQYIDMVKPLYDYVIVDCAPSLDLLTVNALAAADSVIIPVVPKFLDAKGLSSKGEV